MNFLQLAQRLSVECGVSGTGPSSTLNQTGMSGKLVNWIQSAWLEIQGLHDNWGWMREPFAFNTVAGTGDYAPSATVNTLTGNVLSDLRFWHKDTFRCQRVSIGVQDEQWLVEWDYQVFRNTYRFNVQVNNRPVVFAIKPNGKDVMLGSIPDDVYSVTGEYQYKPRSLVGDAAEPEMPNDALHMLIVYKAMQSYGMFEAAPEVIQRGQAEYSRLLNQLEREQLPEVILGNPLA